jgi:mono/diheme cytochrome c family protein
MLRFEQALDPASAGDPRNYGVERWNYLRTEKYGSGHFKLDGSPGQEVLPVAAAHLSEDGHAVLLVLPGMREVMQMGVTYDIAAAGGQQIQNAAYLTLNTMAPLDLNAMGFEDIDMDQVIASAVVHESARASAQPTAALGEELYLRLGCMACHSTDGSLDGKAGPSFKDAFGVMRTFTDGSMARMDEGYIRRSILEPSSQIVEGYHEEMPAYLGVLSDAEIESIALFIKSLGAN